MTFDQAMTEVLERSRYNYLTDRGFNIRAAVSDAFERLIEFLLYQLNFVFPEISEIDNNLLSAIFIVPVVIAASIAIVYIFRRVKRQEKSFQLDDIFEEVRSRRYTVSELLALSRQAAEQRASIRFMFIAIILSLDERRIIEITPSATSALIGRQIMANRPAMLDAHRLVASTYERAWFGKKLVNDANFHAAAETFLGRFA